LEIQKNSEFLLGVKCTLEVYAEYAGKWTFDLASQETFDNVIYVYHQYNITNAWLGDGITNWFEFFNSFKSVERALEYRDTNDAALSKVYRWTVDLKETMRGLLDLGVDGIMTNRPYRAIEVLAERSEYRLALPTDNFMSKFDVATSPMYL